MKVKKVLNDFKFGTFMGHFQSDCAISMAVKGLKMVTVGVLGVIKQ